MQLQHKCGMSYNKFMKKTQKKVVLQRNYQVILSLTMCQKINIITKQPLYCQIELLIQKNTGWKTFFYLRTKLDLVLKMIVNLKDKF